MEWIKTISLWIEYLAVAIIVGMVAYSTVRYFASLVTKRDAQAANYLEYKHTLGRALLLEPTWNNIAALGLVVVIEGHWLWGSRHSNAAAGGHTKGEHHVYANPMEE